MMTTESDLGSPTSTSCGETDRGSKMEDKASYRKSNKPMMEKKRRARINSCLTQLKALVLQAMKKDNSQYSKLEKADILELTVKHLKNVQRYQATGVPSVPEAMSKYRAGFNECANEVMRYLGQSQGVGEEARTRILSHLATILSPINSLPNFQQGSCTPILPAPPSTTIPLQQQQQLQQQLQQQHFHHHHHQQHQHQQQQQQHHQLGVSLLTSTPVSATQPLTIDTNNNKPCLDIDPRCLSHPISGMSFSSDSSVGSLSDSPNAKRSPHAADSSPPTAFHSPVAASAIAPLIPPTASALPSGTSLQLPCLATAPMATASLATAQFHLVPSALPSGQVALVLAPHQGVHANFNVPKVHATHTTTANLSTVATSISGNNNNIRNNNTNNDNRLGTTTIPISPHPISLKVGEEKRLPPRRERSPSPLALVKEPTRHHYELTTTSSLLQQQQQQHHQYQHQQQHVQQQPVQKDSFSVPSASIRLLRKSSPDYRQERVRCSTFVPPTSSVLPTKALPSSSLSSSASSSSSSSFRHLSSPSLSSTSSSSFRVPAPVSSSYEMKSTASLIKSRAPTWRPW